MEFGSPLSFTVDIIPPGTESNLENLEQSRFFCCHQCFIDFGNFFLSIISFIVFIVLPMIEIVIGIVYVNKCPMNVYIPIYLIVAGLISSINLIFAILGWIFLRPSMNDFKFKTIKSTFFEAGIICKIMFSISILFILFGLAWFITGNVWVYGSQSTVQYTNPIGSPKTYCNRVVYLSGFWSIIVKYIFIWLIICRLNCSLCFDVQKLMTEHR